jgi:hypothetical protein
MDNSPETLPPDETTVPDGPGPADDEDDDLDPLNDDDEDDEEAESSLPDWVYAEIVGRLFRMAPESHLKLLGIPATGPVEFVPMPRLTPPQPTGIHVLRLPDDRVAEVHCVREVPKNLVATMAWHRAALLQAHPVGTLEQYVVVIGDGDVRRHDDPVHTGIYFDLKILYLKDIEEEWFPISPGFRFLGRCRTPPWASQVVDAVGATAEPFVVPENPTSGGFAEIEDENQGRLPGHLVSLFLAGRFGVRPEVPVEARHLGWVSAVTMALALYAATQFDEVRRRIGRREGVADVLGDVLRERFGEHPEILVLAYRLAALTDLDAVIQIIATADSLDELHSKYLKC